MIETLSLRLQKTTLSKEKLIQFLDAQNDLFQNVRAFGPYVQADIVDPMRFPKVATVKWTNDIKMMLGGNDLRYDIVNTRMNISIY